MWRFPGRLSIGTFPSEDMLCIWPVFDVFISKIGQIPNSGNSIGYWDGVTDDRSNAVESEPSKNSSIDRFSANFEINTVYAQLKEGILSKFRLILIKLVLKLAFLVLEKFHFKPVSELSFVQNEILSILRVKLNLEQLESNLELLKWRVYEKIGFENTLNSFVSF